MTAQTNRTTPLLVGSALLLGALAPLADAQTLSGTVRWTDDEGLTHPAREARMAFFGEMALPGGGATTVFLGTGATDREGTYSHTFGPIPGLYFISAMARTDNPGGFVSPDGTPGTIYGASAGTFGSGGTIDITTLEPAFSVADAIYSAHYWSSRARSAGALPKATVIFPETGPGDASFYRDTDRTLHIRAWRRFAWDVIDHEYGHYLSDLDDLDQSPNGGHSSGVSNIPTRGKLNGARLAWGEGLATFNGIASHHIDPLTQNLPSTMATVGDTVYTAVHSDDPTRTFSRGVESITGAGNAGEGDEASVYRILWDIADPANEPHDRVERGLATTYRDLESIAGLDQLDDVWDHYFTLAGDDASRTNYGAIFEQYSVSPHPHGGPIGATLGPGSPAPEFEWDRQNNDDNDAFGLIVWDELFTTRLLDLLIPGNVESYTLSTAQWAVLTTAAAGGPIDLNFVIHGSDTASLGGFAYGPDLVTGQFWSDAYRFTVIPTPATLLALGVLPLRRRARG